MALIDTHAHLFDDRFRSDLPAVLNRAADAGVERAVCIGIDRESSLETVRLANQYPILVAAVGIQPNHAAEAQPGDWDAIVKLAESTSPATSNWHAGSASRSSSTAARPRPTWYGCCGRRSRSTGRFGR